MTFRVDEVEDTASSQVHADADRKTLIAAGCLVSLGRSWSRGCGRYCGRMRIHIDAEKCQGHNRCYALAPELFDVDDYGNAVVIGDGEVSPELEERARLAVANCPEFAISISE